MFKKPWIRFFAATVALILFLFVFYELRVILLPFLIGYILHYALKPFVNFLSQRGVKHTLAVVIVFFIFFGIVALLLNFLVPAVFSELSGIQDNLSSYKNALIEKISFLGNTMLGSLTSVVSSSDTGQVDTQSMLSSYLSNYFSQFARKLPSFVISMIPFLLYIFIIPFATFFFLLDEYRIKNLFISRVPNRYFETTLNLFYSLNRQFGWLLRGMLTSMILMSVIISFQLWLIDLDYPILVGIFSGMANLIPYAGPIVGIFSAFLVAIMTGAPNVMYLYIVLVFLIANSIDNIFIQPIIMARAANLHPLVVIFLVLIGSKYGGMLGMLVAVPLASLLQVVLKIIYHEISRPQRPDFSQYRDTSTCG